jgi:hypothetical protein
MYRPEFALFDWLHDRFFKINALVQGRIVMRHGMAFFLEWNRCELSRRPPMAQDHDGFAFLDAVYEGTKIFLHFPNGSFHDQIFDYYQTKVKID